MRFTYGLDNLYISTKFCHVALKVISQKIMTHSVCRTSGRRLLKSVLIQEKTIDTVKVVAQGKSKLQF